MKTRKEFTGSDLAIAVLLVGALGGMSCAVMESLRVGAQTGYVDGAEGHRDMHAVTASVRPLAGMEREQPVSDAQLRYALAQRDEYAEQLAVWEGHVCEETKASEFWKRRAEEAAQPAVGDPTNLPYRPWYESEIIWGGIITVVGLVFGVSEAKRRKWKKLAEQPEP